MVKKSAAFKLSSVKATATEIANAKKLLQSLGDKGKKAKMSAFAHWAKTTGNTEASEARGTSRQD